MSNARLGVWMGLLVPWAVAAWAHGGEEFGTGACCLCSGECFEGWPADACTSQGGTYLGAGSVCGTCEPYVPCPANCNQPSAMIGMTALTTVDGTPVAPFLSPCVLPGQELGFFATIQVSGDIPPDIFCDIEGGEMIAVMPDGTMNEAAGFPGSLVPQIPQIGNGDGLGSSGPFGTFLAVTYVVEMDDADENGFLDFMLEYANGTVLSGGPELVGGIAFDSRLVCEPKVSITSVQELVTICEGTLTDVQLTYRVTNASVAPAGTSLRPDLANVVLGFDPSTQGAACFAPTRIADDPGDDDDMLEPGEIWVYTASCAVSSSMTWTATVSANGVAFFPVGQVIADRPYTATAGTIIDASPPPAATAASSGATCSGGAVQLLAGPGGLDYAWTGPGGYTSDQLSPMLSPAVPGEYCVTVTDAAGCTNMACVTVEVHDVPTATVNSGAVCAGETATLCATVGGGSEPYEYLWDGGQTSPCITTGSAGSYSVLVTDGHGCTTAATGMLDVHPPAELSVETTVDCSGTSAQLCATATGGSGEYDYYWLGSPSGPCFTAEGEGQYCVTVIDGHGCTVQECVEVAFAGGACCFDDGTCIDMPTQAACQATGGSWQCSGTDCSTEPCPGGACCFDDGTCADVATLAECDAAGGAWNGAGSSCATTDCPGGACCFGDGTCELTDTQSACEASGGTWQGAGSDCSVNCEVQSACCFQDGDCAVVSEDECVAIGGTAQPGDCSTPGCLGTCCLLDGTCEDLTVTDCAGADGDYWGYGEQCQFSACPRACCLPDGICTAAFPDVCNVQGQPMGTPTTCDEIICLGACCLPGDLCVILTLNDCDLQGGTYMGLDTECDEVVCPEPCPGDVDDNGIVDVDDLVMVILGWGSDDPAFDTNGDGEITVDDIVTLVLLWGVCP